MVGTMWWRKAFSTPEKPNVLILRPSRLVRRLGLSSSITLRCFTTVSVIIQLMGTWLPWSMNRSKGGKRRYVTILPELAQELRTHLWDRTQGYLFELSRHTAFTVRRIQQLAKETAALAGIT